MILSRSRPLHVLFTALMPALLCVIGCDDGPTPVVDGAAVDRGPDMAPDPTDVSPPDAAPDAALDAEPDAAPDADLDAVVDADLDAALDARPDAAPDMTPEPDAIPDAERLDFGSPFRDVGPVDPLEPCDFFDCVCEPGAEEPCYPGPPDTEGSGICVGGVRTCAEDGRGFGPCVGARVPLGEDCRTAEDEDCDGETPPCSDVWLRTYANGGNQAVRSVAVAPNGDVLVLLDFDYTLNLGAGPVTSEPDTADVGLARYDRQGNPVWSRRFGDSAHDFAGQLAIGPAGEVAMLMRFYGTLPLGDALLDSDGVDDIALLLLEPDGTRRWSRRLGGVQRDGSERVTFDGEGRVLVTGRFQGQVRFGPDVFTSAGLSDAFVTVYAAADGALEVARQAGGLGEDIGRGIAAGPDGTVYVAGRFEQIISWGGAPIESAGAGDVFVTALEPDGAHRWTRHFAGPADDGLYDLVYDPVRDALYAFGWFGEALDYGGEQPLESAGSADFFVARITPEGEATAVAFGDAGDQTETPFVESSYGALALGPDGVYLAGPFGGGVFGLQAVGGVDGFAARLDRDLNLQAALGFGTLLSEMALDIAVDPAGGVVIGGRFYSQDGPVIGPLGPLVGAGRSDGFVVRLLDVSP